MSDKVKRRIALQVRIAGWLCLFPAYGTWYAFQSFHETSFIFATIISILYGAFLLTTAATPRWENPRALLRTIIFSIVFVAILPAIPLYFAYRNARNYNKR